MPLFWVIFIFACLLFVMMMVNLYYVPLFCKFKKSKLNLSKCDFNYKW